MSVRSAHFQAGRLGRANQGTRLARVLAAGMAHTVDASVTAEELRAGKENLKENAATKKAAKAVAADADADAAAAAAAAVEESKRLIRAKVDYAAANVKPREDANGGAGAASWEADDQKYNQAQKEKKDNEPAKQAQEVIDQNTPISKPLKEYTEQEKRDEEAFQARAKQELEKQIQMNRRKSQIDGSDDDESDNESDDETQASPRAQTPSRRKEAAANLEAQLANRPSEPRPQADTTPAAPAPEPAPMTPPTPQPQPAPAPAAKPPPPPNKPKPTPPRPPKPGEPGPPPPKPKATAPATAPEPELPKTPSLKTLGNVVLAANELQQATPPPTPPTPQPQPQPAPAPASATEWVTWTLMTDPNLSAANLRLRQLMVELMAA